MISFLVLEACNLCLTVSCRAALRASCKANKAVVDAHVQEARYYGVARNSRHEASLPPYIRRVQVSISGCVSRHLRQTLPLAHAVLHHCSVLCSPHSLLVQMLHAGSVAVWLQGVQLKPGCVLLSIATSGLVGWSRKRCLRPDCMVPWVRSKQLDLSL